MALQRMSHTGAAPATSLSAGLAAAATSGTLTSAAGYPTGAGGRPFVIVVDPGTALEEKILCATITGVTFNVASGGRGWDDTLPTDHTAGAAVEHVLAAREVDDVNDHTYTPGRDDHTQYGRVDGTRPYTGPVTMNAGLTVTGGPTTLTGNLTDNGNTHITGTLAADGPATLGAGLNLTGNQTVSGTLTVAGATSLAGMTASGNITASGDLTANTLKAAGITGTSGPARWVGTTTSGPPTTGSFLVDDIVADAAGVVWVCTTAGSPGTWTAASVFGNPAGHAAATGQTIVGPDNTYVALILASQFLKGGMLYTSNTFKVPVAGVYRVSGQTIYQSGNAVVVPGRYALALYQNGAMVRQGEDDNMSANPSFPCPTISSLVNAAANDTFGLYGYKSNGGVSVGCFGNTANTYFSIELVSR